MTYTSVYRSDLTTIDLRSKNEILDIPTHEEYGYNDFQIHIKSLVTQLKDQNIDYMVGVSRGGCIPAVVLSHALSIPVTMIDHTTRDGVNLNPVDLRDYFKYVTKKIGSNKNILIVDDIIDNGSTIMELLNVSNIFYNVSVACLLYNENVVTGVDVFYGRKYNRRIEKQYFNFWWETMSKEKS